METFKEYEAAATKVPASLRNSRGRIDLPIFGLQEEAGKIGSLLVDTFSTGKFILTAEQSEELKMRLSDILWYTALLCNEARIPLQIVAENSLVQLAERTEGLDPDQR